MNLILLEKEESQVFWETEDSRTQHVRNVLGLGVGDSFFVGIQNGRIGKARILEDGPKGIMISMDLQWDSPSPLPVDILIGLPRPQVAKRLLREIPSLGPENVTFFIADKSEPSYRQSKLWKTEEWEKLLQEGAEQAFSTLVPKIRHMESLTEAINGLERKQERIAFDLYETEGSFDISSVKGEKRLAMAFGPEGGWTSNERRLLRKGGFRLLALGPRVLRVETAVISALSLAASHLGKLDMPLVP
jgi:16S rRNA (uracil1498-N3)-methyltransferase